MKLFLIIFLFLSFSVNISAQPSVAELEAQAKKGNVEAMKNLGVELFISGDEKKGMSWLEKAASKGEVSGLEFIADYLNDFSSDPYAAIPIYKKAIKKGSFISLQRLGLLYYGEKNYKEALKWFEKGMKAGDPFCEFMLGKAYYEGNITKKNVEKGFDLISYAANSDNEHAQLYLYYIYKERKPEIAEEWLKKAGRNGNKKALDILISKNNGTNNVYEWLEIKAEKGDKKAAIEMAKYYLLPNKKDLNKALNFADIADEEGNEIKNIINLQKQADSGDTDAMIKIGNYYKKGHTVDRDPVIARQYLEKAANAGNLEAMKTLVKNRLDVNDPNFDGEIVNDENFIKFLVTLSQQPNPEVEYLLEAAQFYMDHGNTNEAFSWWEKASGIGDGTGYYNIAKAYDEGNGIGKDSQKGFEYYSKAAEKGHPEAMYKLGIYYETGINGEKNIEKAKEWYKRASENGVNNGLIAYNKLEYGIKEPIKGTKLTRLHKNEKYSVLDENGKVIVPEGKYAFIDTEIILYGKKGEISLIEVRNEQGLKGAIASWGDLIIPVKYYSVGSIGGSKGYRQIGVGWDKNDNKTFFNKYSGVILGGPGKYTGLDDKFIDNGFVTVYNGKKLGVVNFKTGKEIIPPIYTEFQNVSPNGNYLLVANTIDGDTTAYIYSSAGVLVSKYFIGYTGFGRQWTQSEALRFKRWLNSYGFSLL